MKFRRAALLSSIACIASVGFSPVWAQDQALMSQAEDQEYYDEDEAILVLADRMRGEVDAPQPPIQVLSEEDIAAYGAGSLAELLEQLTPQTTSGRGRGAGGFPALLVNGMRVSSFREIRSYPPESIQKIEILPEEVALRYGYSADQRVVNIILKDNYSSAELEVEYGQPWSGGYWAGELEGTYLRIDGSNRLNINAEVSRSGALTEYERDILQPDTLIPTVAGDPDPALQRLLRDPGTEYGVNATYAMSLGGSGGSLSLNSAFERSRGNSADGYNIVLLTAPGGDTERRVVNPGDVITSYDRSTTWSAGMTFNQPIGAWNLTATMDGSIARTRNVRDRALDMSGLVADALAGLFPIDGTLPVLAQQDPDLARTTTRTLNSLATLRGSLFWLPAGDVSATFRAGYNITDYESEDTRNVFGPTSLSRNVLTAGANIGVPLTSRRDDVLAAVGDIALNFSAGIEDLSDFGSLVEWSAGLTWAPTERLNLQATYLYGERAPGLTQLGGPTIVRENVAVYDFATNQTALVSTISGGNPGLLGETRKDWRFSAQWDLPFYDDARLQVEYFHNRSYDIASGFPSILTPEIEAAFPGRVTRDLAGNLQSMDLRPVTFASQVSKRMRWGINFGGRLGKARPQSDTAQQGGFGGFAGAGAGQGGSQAGSQRGGQGGPPGGGNFNPEAFQAMRARLCGDGADKPGAIGDDGSIDPEVLEAMPEQMRARLMGPDGQIDPERVRQFRDRICSADAPQPGQGGFRFRGPPAGVAGGGPGGAGGPPAGAGGGPPGGGVPGFMRGPGGGDGRGRFFANLFHTIELQNEITIAPGIPVLDLLDGDALSGGGTVRHSFELEGGMFYRGKGMRLSGRYSGPSRVDGSGLPGSTDLRFGSLATLDLRFFVDLGQQEKLVASHPFLKGSRIAFDISNVFDSYRKVTDSNGEIPLRYQRGLIDPVGRYFEISFRKLF